MGPLCFARNSVKISFLSPRAGDVAGWKLTTLADLLATICAACFCLARRILSKRPAAKGETFGSGSDRWEDDLDTMDFNHDGVIGAVNARVSILQESEDC